MIVVAKKTPPEPSSRASDLNAPAFSARHGIQLWWPTSQLVEPKLDSKSRALTAQVLRSAMRGFGMTDVGSVLCLEKFAKQSENGGLAWI
jgi:hypothetical protein